MPELFRCGCKWMQVGIIEIKAAVYAIHHLDIQIYSLTNREATPMPVLPRQLLIHNIRRQLT